MQKDKEVLEKVLQLTAEHFKITREDIVNGSRKAFLVDARVVYAVVSMKYVANKKRIAEHIKSHSSSLYNWIKRHRGYDVNNGVYVVTAKMENGVERYKYEQMLKEFDRKMEEHFAFTQELQALKLRIEKQKKLIL